MLTAQVRIVIIVMRCSSEHVVKMKMSTRVVRMRMFFFGDDMILLLSRRRNWSGSGKMVCLVRNVAKLYRKVV